MKSIFFTGLILFVLGCNSPQKWETHSDAVFLSESTKKSLYIQRLDHFRDSLSAVFYSGSNNVLPKEAISTHGKLSYYPPDETYRVKATFKPIVGGEVFQMKTNTDRLPEYKKFGKISFFINQQALELTLYQNVEQPEYLFCPFKDRTNGNETYGSGRFLDFSEDDLDNLVLDFNYAYNPYCAYNKNYSCPIPPPENHLNVAIPAGEKKWH